MEYCTFCDIEYRNIIKHVNVRWLSLEKAVYRVLQQYDGLRSYFLSNVCTCTLCAADDHTPRFIRLRSALSNSTMEIYLLFYESVLQTFVHFNKFLQREDPLIPNIREQMDSF